MTIMTSEREADADRFEPGARTPIEVVHQAHDALELPEGYTAQIIKGLLVIMATPNARHAYIVGEIEDALRGCLPAGLRTYQNTTGQEPDGDRYIPDLGVWPKALLRSMGDEWVFDATQLLVAVEVTSRGQEAHDYDKVEGYARAGVPVYLIVDRKRRRCVLFTEPQPAKGLYQTTHTTDFGEPLTIPLEAPVVVDTAEF